MIARDSRVAQVCDETTSATSHSSIMPWHRRFKAEHPRTFSMNRLLGKVAELLPREAPRPKLQRKPSPKEGARAPESQTSM